MELVEIVVVDGVATLTLNDPARRNVVSADMNAALVDAVDRLEDAQDVRALVITGAAPAFSAGGHLDDLLAVDDGPSLRSIYAGFLRVAGCELPTVAAVNGAAVGAGMNLALACDLIVAGESARFDSRFLQIAIHPGGGHTWRLRHNTDLQTAKAMVLFGAVLSGQEAAQAGLAWRCYPDDELLQEAQALAGVAAAAPPELVRSIKATFAAGLAVDSSDAAVDLELEPQVISTRQPAFHSFVADLKARIAAKKG
ncbi:MAG: enoyl-CoA hydratase-related protein [Acidimicrobiia bacterium]|nr:enoyl-CoA hydratase-related protein [Acidimicrobiia bacterium]MDH5238992.1 enoyl-CoA hydratase-related protein [Acidimicrobiia bacterium]